MQNFLRRQEEKIPKTKMIDFAKGVHKRTFRIKYVTSQKMQEIDKRATEDFGIPSIVLMENAGYKAFCVALDMLLKKGKRVVCVCGKGNNGGDGFVCARHLINRGIETDIFLIGDPAELKKDAKINYDILQKMGKLINSLKTKEDFLRFKIKLTKARLLIDAIFGIGLSGEIKEPYRTAVEVMNQSKKPILAIDMPSGLDATTGNILGICINAKKTVTFGLPKIGLIRNHGPLNAGELITVDISLPKQLLR